MLGATSKDGGSGSVFLPEWEESLIKELGPTVLLSSALAFAFFGPKAQQYFLIVIGFLFGTLLSFFFLTTEVAKSVLSTASSPNALAAIPELLQKSPDAQKNLLLSVVPGLVCSFCFYKLIRFSIYLLGLMLGAFVAKQFAISFFEAHADSIVMRAVYEKVPSWQFNIFVYWIFAMAGAKFLSRGTLG
ncbi:unnamed protein product [Amoebophrya sp. A120]|nr:unnamed protein product [Amoebophrya sp. A120]|eukprot:GSA120T00021366001.1